MQIEEIAAVFESIPPSRDGMWTVHEISKGRLYLGKAEGNEAALFIEGTKESFGVLPVVSAIQHSEEVTSLPSGRKFQALRITSSDESNGFRIVAHILYELAWRLERNPQPSNQALLSEISWLFGVLGGRRLPMSIEKQLGLIGESIFLRRLLLRAHEREIGAERALACWAGASLAKRDFYGVKTVVEVKTTRHVVRLHHISSLDQLVAQEEGESVYLFSLGIRGDPTAPKKLNHFVADIEALLVDKAGKPINSAIDHFRGELDAYGFDWGDRDLYERQSGFLAPHLQPELYAANDLNFLETEHFVGGQPPDSVRGISYSLEISIPPLSAAALQKVCDAMLGLP